MSHSSKDKHFVKTVAEAIGLARCEYDEYTFDYVLNAQAIRRAFLRCDLFILFLSANSIQSNFVAEETRTALDFRAQGQLKKVLVISLDQTSFKALPEWMQAINVVTRLSTPQTCARKIDAELFALEAEADKTVDIYIPREDDEAALRRALSKPPGVAPVAVHVVGHAGIGRRTFIRKSLSALFPRLQAFVPIALNRYEGANEFYRRLHDHFVASSVNDKIHDFERFAQSSEEQQVEILSDLFAEILRYEECVVVEDAGGVYDEDGSYQRFISETLKTLKGASRPVITFSQTRMMPLRLREQAKESYFTFLTALNDDKIREMLSFSFRDSGIDFSQSQINELCSLVDGYPVNVKLAVKAVESYGLAAFLAEPSVLLEWKRRRSEDFLSQIEFSKLECDIISLLVEFRYLSFEFIRENVKAELADLAEALRNLEDFCCIERRGTLYVVSAPVQEGARRDKRFKKSDRWRSQIALKIVDQVSKYRNDESVSIAVLETGAKAAIMSGKYSGIAAAFILPSHFLTLAREAYDDENRRKDCLEFCKKAYALRTRLSADGNIELLRLWGLAAIRIGLQDEIDFALKELEKFASKRIAKRHSLFLEGFKARLKKRYDEAETFFLKANKLSSKNLSINRELASLYRHQGEFIEAEGYARDAYSISPTNPFVLDVLLESLLGKASQGIPVDQQEIARLFRELERYGDVPGSSFYQARRAQELYRQRLKPQALEAANAAIARTPDFLPCYYLRADIRLSLPDIRGAREDLEKINEILERRGGFSEDDEGRTDELEVKTLTAEKQYRAAKDKLHFSQFIPNRVRAKLARSLAAAISFEQSGVDSNTRRWAQGVLK